LFTPRKALWYIEHAPLGGDPKGSQGQNYFTAPNPPFGANFTYYLRDDLKTLKEIRQEKEKELAKNNQDISFPGWNAIDAEQMQHSPRVYLSICDTFGNVVKQIECSTKKGMHRVNWDLSFSSLSPISFQTQERGDFRGRGFMAAPGKYKAFLSKEVDGMVSQIGETVEFEVEQLQKGSLNGATPVEATAFWKEISGFQAQLSALMMVFNETKAKGKAMQKALVVSNNKDAALIKRVFDFNQSIAQFELKTFGSPSKAQIGEKGMPTLMDRLSVAMMGNMSSTYGPTATHKQSLAIAQKEYNDIYSQVKQMVEVQLPSLEKALKAAGAPYIQGEGLPQK
jgi:hypothetical protein